MLLFMGGILFCCLQPLRLKRDTFCSDCSAPTASTARFMLRKLHRPRQLRGWYFSNLLFYLPLLRAGIHVVASAASTSQSNSSKNIFNSDELILMKLRQLPV